MKELAALLAKRRINISSEGTVQSAIQEVLDGGQIEYQREARLDPGSRPDFLLKDGTAVEVKVDGWSPRKIYRQLERYAQHPSVTKILLVTSQAIHLPPEILGKQAAVFRLGEAWL